MLACHFSVRNLSVLVGYVCLTLRLCGAFILSCSPWSRSAQTCLEVTATHDKLCKCLRIRLIRRTFLRWSVQRLSDDLLTNLLIETVQNVLLP